ncbi:MAG: glycosyl hydrolase [Burkholderiales bacterium]|nr:glycosyl hydrolase [Burkholderiales bacterium]MDE1925854.1 glycosyl hydrolase [Burkholderiales bacterium]MDE2503065.1 glycosyl hydrolase [Burkholderiales bacterium]
MNPCIVGIARCAVIWACLGAGLALAEAPAAPASELVPHSAELSKSAVRAPMLGAALAGRRIVAVGDHGIVLLSDDDGASYRQARAVPVNSTLTAVSFVDAKQGWAVGQWGVILHTADGGETWKLQTYDVSVDQPLFSVYFADALHGWAVGLWSKLLSTADGGKTWNQLTVPPPPGGGRADKNLFAIFPGPHGELFVAAEHGYVLHSVDGGANWNYLETGYKGTFWTGITLADGTVIVGGLRGTIYRSVDDGRSWQPSATGTRNSITGIAAVPRRIVACGLDGTVLESNDGGVTFKATQRDDRVALTAVVATATDHLKLFSKQGPIPEALP